MSRKNKKKKKRSKIFLGIKIFILVLLLAILGTGLFLYFRYGDEVFTMQDEAKQLVEQSTVNTFRASETSIAYNAAGKQVAILKGEKDSYYLTFSEIPQYVKQAMIVTEDKNFYTHSGIDIMANIRAVLALVQHSGEITQGASTITQQLSRDVFLTQKVSYERKIKEIFVAMEIEKKYTKDQILEFYLNNIFFANGYYGIEAAARGYFSKSSKELSLGELCFLCAIPNNPSLYNPLRHKDNTIKRKNRILDQMLADKVINSVEYDEAYHQKIELNVKEVKTRNYVQTFIMRCATRKLMEHNGFEFRNTFDSDEEQDKYNDSYDEAYDTAQKELFNSGYRVYTSLDMKKQKVLQSAINKNLSAFKEKTKKGVYKMQGAGTCIDNETGRVVAIVGGRSQKNQGYTLNRAYQSYRQPGSSIKPLIVYTPALERGYTPNTIVRDVKTKDGPSNSSPSYWGSITLRTAVEQSKNTVAWQIFQKLTPKVGLNYLYKMNYARIVKSDYYLPASLGGLTYGCSTVEMASGYATLANEGKYRDPTCIVKITDSDGNEIVSDDISQKFIYKEDAAHTMVDIMQGVFTRGTAKGLAVEKMPCAGKTGTTNDKKDGWFCGFTPYYTTSIWIGYDQPRTVADLYGATYPGKTWNAFMSEIHKDLKEKEFKGIKSQVKSTSQSSYGQYNNSEYNNEESDSDNEEESEKKKSASTKKKTTTTKAPAATQAPATDPGTDAGQTEDTPDDTATNDGGYNQDDTQYQGDNFNNGQ